MIAYVLIQQGRGICYVGITRKSLKWRYTRHIYDSRHQKRPAGPTAIEAAFRLFGPEAFHIEAIASATCYEHLKELECILIDQLGTRDPSGYNLMLGKSAHCERTRQKMAISHTGKKQSEATKAKRIATLTGRVFSNEHKAKLAVSAKARSTAATAAHLAPFSAAKRGKPGLTHTPETKDKMSASQTARWSRARG